MKNILIISLLILWMTTLGQENYLLKRFYRLNPGDTSYGYKYYYKDDLSLNNYQLIINNGVISEFFFENDTLISSQEYDKNYTYHYFNDSVIQIEWSSGSADTAIMHYLDEQDRVIHTHRPDFVIDHYYNEWEGENVFKHSYNLMGVLKYFTFDYSEYLNPLYPIFASLGINNKGSYNYPSAQYNESGNLIYTYDVVETIGSYPTVVNGWDGNTNHQLRYEYIIVNDVEESPVKEQIVFSVEYFDVIGRKIPKPENGLYIERKTTDKGIISTTYFKQ